MSPIAPRLLSAIVASSHGDEAAARALVRRWEATLRENDRRAERIRADVRDAACSCASTVPAEGLPDGRCSRCFGRIRRTDR